MIWSLLDDIVYTSIPSNAVPAVIVVRVHDKLWLPDPRERVRSIIPTVWQRAVEQASHEDPRVREFRLARATVYYRYLPQNVMEYVIYLTCYAPRRELSLEREVRLWLPALAVIARQIILLLIVLAGIILAILVTYYFLPQEKAKVIESSLWAIAIGAVSVSAAVIAARIAELLRRR